MEYYDILSLVWYTNEWIVYYLNNFEQFGNIWYVMSVYYPKTGRQNWLFMYQNSY